jgi:TonB-linked SusC/RagA family outer membrane protein
LTFRGGSDFVKYFFLLGIVDQRGLYEFTDVNKGYSTQNEFLRYNFRSNVDINLSKAFNINVNLGGRVENRHTPGSSAEAIISSLSKNPPTMPVFNDNQSLAGSLIYTNPYGLIAKSGFQDRFARYLQGTVTANLKLNSILEGLSVNGLFRFDASKLYGRSKSQSFAVYQQNSDNTYTQFGEDTNIDLNYSGWDSSFGLMMNYMAGLSYDKSFNKNQIDVDLKYMQSSLSTDGDNPDYRNQGIFGRVTYTYNQRYTGEFGYCYNGSEDFKAGRRFGFFPTISGAWVISNENFMKNNKTINFLKLRGSYGEVGNSNIGVGYRFPFEQKFYGGNGYYFGTSSTDGSYEGRIANPYITWEKSIQANIGLDATLFNKLEMSIDVFRNNRNHIITDPSSILPLFIGQSLPYINEGSVLSKGFELTVKHINRINKFGYSIEANASLAQNTITAIDEVSGMNSWEYKKGQSVMQQWGLQVSSDKFFKDQADIDNWAKSSYGSVQPGDVKYVDQNKDGIIDKQDYVPLGNPSVPELNYNLSLGCDYRGFYFNVLLSGVANRSLFVNNCVLWGLQNNNNLTSYVAENSWGVSSNPIFPRLTTMANPNNYQSSSLWLMNADYLKIQAIEFGYNLPKKILFKSNINEIRIFIKGYDLFSFDSLKKFNLSAEIPNAGVTQYPETRVVNIGANFKF